MTMLALSSGCATTPPRTAAVVPTPVGGAQGRSQVAASRPAEPSKPFPNLIEEQPPFSYSPNAKSDTPECRALFDDFNQTWRRATHCERDEDCTTALGPCTAARADLASVLVDKRAAVGPCVDILLIPICDDPRAICFEKECRVRGREAK